MAEHERIANQEGQNSRTRFCRAEHRPSFSKSSSRRNHRGNGTCWLLMRLTKESALSTFERYRYSAWNAMSIVVHPLERGQMLCTARSNIRSQPQKIFVISNILELNCWVLGDDLRSVFSVEIPSSKAVSYLK